MEYFIIILVIPATLLKSVENSRIPLLNNHFRAPLVAELDISDVKKELKEYTDSNIVDQVNETCRAKIETVVKKEVLELKNDILENYSQSLNNTMQMYDKDFTAFKQKLTDEFTVYVKHLRKETEDQIGNLTTEYEGWKVDILKTKENMKLELEKLKINMTYLHKRVAGDCSDVRSNGDHESGVYLIYPSDGKGFKVYCDMDTDGGGWTVFQKRFNGETDFFRGWNDYKEGFGDPKAEYWLGNSKLSMMTSQRQYELRIDLEDFQGTTAYAKYSNFSIGDESTKYKLSIGGYSGTAGDSLNFHNNMAFSTKDMDNEKDTRNCAVQYKGAWWYKGCHHSNLNGYYRGTDSENNGMSWYHWKQNHQSLKSTSMMIRRKKS